MATTARITPRPLTDTLGPFDNQGSASRRAPSPGRTAVGHLTFGIGGGQPARFSGTPLVSPGELVITALPLSHRTGRGGPPKMAPDPPQPPSNLPPNGDPAPATIVPC